jgi:ABC-2 type transport system ATP-binding protein
MAEAPYIEFRCVSKKFRNNLVLDRLYLKIPYREITGIIGVSGSGKTTLLKLLIGFLKPSKGDIFFQSRKVTREGNQIKKIFGFATEDGAFYEKLTVKENVHYFGSLYGMKKKEITQRTNELLKLVELKHAQNCLADELSVGMKRRLDIACALIHKPKVLILDEPTEDLDPLLRREILNLIRKIKKEGTTVIITSHLLNEIDEICGFIAILHNGRIVRMASPSKIKKHYAKETLDEVLITISKEEKKSKNFKKEKKKSFRLLLFF